MIQKLNLQKQNGWFLKRKNILFNKMIVLINKLKKKIMIYFKKKRILINKFLIKNNNNNNNKMKIKNKLVIKQKIKKNKFNKK